MPPRYVANILHLRPPGADDPLKLPLGGRSPHSPLRCRAFRTASCMARSIRQLTVRRAQNHSAGSRGPSSASECPSSPHRADQPNYGRGPQDREGDRRLVPGRCAQPPANHDPRRRADHGERHLGLGARSCPVPLRPAVRRLAWPHAEAAQQRGQGVARAY